MEFSDKTKQKETEAFLNKITRFNQVSLRRGNYVDRSSIQEIAVLLKENNLGYIISSKKREKNKFKIKNLPNYQLVTKTSQIPL